MKTAEITAEILAAPGWTQAKLAAELGVTQPTVHRWLKGSDPGGPSTLRLMRLHEQVTGTARDPGLRTVRVAAHVQAGYWAETWEWTDDEQYEVAVPDDPQLRHFKLYAAETRGPSMNRRWPEQTVVVFTDVDETQEAPVPGKRYVVQRLRSDGQREHTVKLLHRDDSGKLWLIPESTDPLFQAPISIEDGTNDGDVVAIIGRVHFAVTRE